MSLTKSQPFSESPSLTLNLPSLLLTSSPSLNPPPGLSDDGTRKKGSFFALYSQQLRKGLPPHFPRNSTVPVALTENVEPANRAVVVLSSTWSSRSWGHRGRILKVEEKRLQEGMALTFIPTPPSPSVSPPCGPPSSPEDQWGFTFTEISDTAPSASCGSELTGPEG